MRILFTTIAAAAHFHPTVPLAWALRAAGHEVRVACEPGFTATVTQSGLPALAVGQDVDLRTFWQGHDLGPREDMTAEEHQRLRLTRAIGMFSGIAAAAADDVIAFAASWRPDLVVFEARAYAGLIAARRLGVPAVRHLWGLDTTYGRRDFDAPALEELWSRYGLEGVDPLGDLTVAPCPPSLAEPGELPRKHIRYVPYNGPGVMPSWLLRPVERPRVCVTWGHMFAQRTGTLHGLELAVAALRHLPVEVVAAITPGQRALLGEVPPEVRIVESMPLNLLLPTCDAVVNGGGAGTMMTALASSVPMIMVPSHADEYHYAERLGGAGAAVSVDYRQADAAAIERAAATVLGDPAYGTAATRLRDENALLPTPGDLVADLEKLAVA
ncbi:nucleotide disphospho-sugar-binding domain-containing protein [Nonomuraea sp. B1E8]|uniref:nucleotide disphospho-sugar-binding domain-containing protein n=1 Tax=unclassified Nonomuraea TaxID=2593643 RepID=UPI00325EFC0C